MAVALAEALFRPRGIAIVGASNDPAKLSGRPLDYLLRLGFQGGIYPVNPKRSEVQGVRAYPSLAEIDGPVDLAIVVVPSSAVVQALRDSAEAGATAAIVFASGFAEMPGKGAELQSQVEQVAAETGLRLVGPNCLGSFCIPTAAYATFSSAFDVESSFPDDPIAVVSQSGAVGTYTFATLTALGVGVRYFANTGNEADVTVAELLQALAGDPGVEVLIGYLEDARRLDLLEAAAAAAREAAKPMILLKSGATAPGARAVGFHTGSTPGDDAEFTRRVERNGAIRVDSMEAAADAALAFRNGRRSGGRRLAIVTVSGGAAALAADAAVQLGLEVNEFAPDLRSAIAPILPEYGSTANPIDLTGSFLTDPTMLQRVMAEVLPSSEVDMVMVVLGNAERGADALIEGIASGYGGTDKPFAVVWSGAGDQPRRKLLERKIPTYTDPLRAVRALAHLANFSRRSSQGANA